MDPTSASLPNLTCADERALVAQYATDWDQDGYYVDYGELDCNDWEASWNPGNDRPLCNQVFDYEQDIDCNGNPDGEDCEPSPIVVDVVGNGFSLTNKEHGVLFDIFGWGRKRLIPWTSPDGDDAWLVLDRNANGLIDDFTELFGDMTPQPASDDPNGFEALAVFDRGNQGGNGDGRIDRQDSVYARLRLWHDGNQDGISQADELRGLAAAGLQAMSLTYRDFRRVDRWGNWFRYGARVFDGRNRDIGPWAFDVFFGAEPPRGRRRQ